MTDDFDDFLNQIYLEDSLQDDAFTQKLMQRLHRGQRWRCAVLSFCAGLGLLLGIGLSLHTGLQIPADLFSLKSFWGNLPFFAFLGFLFSCVFVAASEGLFEDDRLG